MSFSKSLLKKLEKAFQPVHDFIVKYHGHPLLWIFVFIGGLLLFRYLYEKLNKEG